MRRTFSRIGGALRGAARRLSIRASGAAGGRSSGT